MRSLNVDATGVDLQAQTAPFLEGYTVVVLNTSSASINLQSSPTAGSGFTTLQAVGAGEAEEVTLDNRFIQASGATGANLILLGN